MDGWLYLIFGAAIAGLMIYRAGFSPQAKAEQARLAEAHKKIVCPHCHQLGGVSVRQVQQKQGISGGKATAGILTGGVSLVAVGLSKKGWVNELTCSNCSVKWHQA